MACTSASSPTKLREPGTGDDLVYREGRLLSRWPRLALLGWLSYLADLGTLAQLE